MGPAYGLHHAVPNNLQAGFFFFRPCSGGGKDSVRASITVSLSERALPA